MNASGTAASFRKALLKLGLHDEACHLRSAASSCCEGQDALAVSRDSWPQAAGYLPSGAMLGRVASPTLDQLRGSRRHKSPSLRTSTKLRQRCKPRVRLLGREVERSSTRTARCFQVRQRPSMEAVLLLGHGRPSQAKVHHLPTRAPRVPAFDRGGETEGSRLPVPWGRLGSVADLNVGFEACNQFPVMSVVAAGRPFAVRGRENAPSQDGSIMAG